MRTKKYKVALLVVIVLLCGITIAYAALSTTLTITFNKVTQAGSDVVSWSQTMTCSKTNDVGTSATGRTCGAITVSGTAATIADTTLSKPGDGCVYKCTITNTGKIAAKINTIVPTSPTSITCTNTSASSSATAKMVCGNITYGVYASATVSGTTITTTNLTAPSAAIATNGTKDFYVVAQYTGTALNSSAVTQTGGKFTFTLAQS